MRIAFPWKHQCVALALVGGMISRIYFEIEMEGLVPPEK
jgi:hypothetical protein